MKIKDIIYREDAIKALHEEWDGGWIEVTGEWVADNCEAVLNRLPSADRPQGEWIDKGDYAECSNCGAHSGTQYDGVEPIPLKTNFCPNCGCQMKGADDEESDR